MKTFFKLQRLCFLFIVLALTINSCSKNDDDISYDLSGNWKVIYFLDDDRKITKTEENTYFNINNGDITVKFTEPDENGKGVISGIKVTNTYSGVYTASNIGEISIENIISTDVNEPEWAKLYSNNINASQHFEIRNSTLLIYYNNRENIIACERQ